MKFNKQITRIIEKLKLAAKTDPSFKVFGARSHQYKIGNPVTITEVEAFERQYNIELPECYKAFVLHIGNGGTEGKSNAAGPNYGVYAFGNYLEELCEDPKISLQNSVKIHPKLSAKEWKEITEVIDHDDTTDEEYEQQLQQIYGGILPILSQGCTYLNAIVLNGPHKGKVVNLDMDLNRPMFCYEANFFDWYERWLDEVNSGKLLAKNADWFGFHRSGSTKELIDGYLNGDPYYKRSYLQGLHHIAAIDQASYKILDQEFLNATNPEIKRSILGILFKSNSEYAKPYLIELGTTDLLAVFQFVFWYAKDKYNEWLPYIKENLHRIEDAETLRFCTYVLEGTNYKYESLLIPLTSHQTLAIREQTFYTLSQLENKTEYLDIFIKALSDSSTTIVRYGIQALAKVDRPDLLRAYKDILNRFPEETDYILVNLNNRLRELGFTETQLRNMSQQQVGKWIKDHTKQSRFKFWRK